MEASQYEGELGQDGCVVQCGQATCRVRVSESREVRRRQGGGGLAQAKSSSVVPPMALQSETGGRASRRPWQTLRADKHDQREPSPCSLEPKVGDATRECEGEIDGSSRVVSLPQADALKRRETGSGNGRRETAARVPVTARNREEKYGCGWC